MIAGRQFDIDLKRAVRAGAKFLRRDFDLFGVWTRRGFQCLHVLHRRRETVDTQRARAFCFQIDDTNRMIVCIGDVEISVREGQSAGFIKRRRAPSACPGFPVPSRRRDFLLLSDRVL